ncbi:hypothetical protein TNCV_4514891 [Trichonephila clavipes]|nr:hypothetical protein TNCV_4514891 [Trichonephila clavipes]
MIGRKIPSVLDRVATISVDSYPKHFYNETIYKSVLKDFALKHQARVPHRVILGMISSFPPHFLLKWKFFHKYSKRMELRYSIFFWQLVNYLSWLFVNHQVTVVSCLYDRIDTYGWPEQSKQYLLALYSYTFVLLALFSYNVVFKTFFRIPISRLKWCIIFAVLCITSSFSTLYGVYIHSWSESDEDSLINTYRRIGFVVLRNPEPREIIIFLLWNHIIPGFLISFLMGRVILKLVKRNEWDLLDKDKTHSISYEDRKYITLSLPVCVFFVITNSLFILRTTVQLLTDSEVIDYYIPSCFDISPFVILPVDVLLITFPWNVMRVFKPFVCFTHSLGAVGSLVVRASDSRPEGLGSMLDVTKYPPSAHGVRAR